MFFGWFRSKKEDVATTIEKRDGDQQKQAPHSHPEVEQHSSSDDLDTNSEESMEESALERLRKTVDDLNDSNSANFLIDLRNEVVYLMQNYQNLLQLKVRQAELFEESDWLEEQDEEDYQGNFDWELSNKKIRTYEEIKNISSRIDYKEQTITRKAEELLEFANSFTRFLLSKVTEKLPDPLDSFEYFKLAGTGLYLQEKGYLSVLSRKANQMIYYDEYGDIRAEKFQTELENFVKKRELDEVNECILELIPDVISDVLTELDRLTSPLKICSQLLYANPDPDDSDDETAKTLHNYGKDQFKSNVMQVVLMQYFNQSASNGSSEEESESKSVEPISTISPYEYEEKIGQKFKILGWKTIVTKASGDQGADVIIEKDKHRGVVQCKMYSQPVGNKAVQEVHAAKSYYDATFAVVVSNQDFTPSARMLATKLGVYLINDSDLRNFSELF